MKETKRKKSLKEKGITLVAIVVTIVILLILAAVTINMTLGSNGLFIRAQDSRAQYENSTANEVEQMNSITGILDGMIDNNGGGGTTPPSGGGYTNVDTSITNPAVVTPTGSTVIEADANKGIVIKDTNQNEWVWIEVPKTATVYPKVGLEVTTFTDEEYTAIEADLQTYATIMDYDDIDDTWYSEYQGVTDRETYNNLKRKMLKSVYKNGGFWIGRYETGIKDSFRDYSSDPDGEYPITQTPVSQANAYPYNYVRSLQAQTLASQMAPSEYTGSLMFGVQWNLVERYLEAKGTNPGTSAASMHDAIGVDSRDWGNYGGSTSNTTNLLASYSKDYGHSWNRITSSYPNTSGALLTTGASDRNSILNIYDFAGNVWEFTLESFEGRICMVRGGSYCSAYYYREANSVDGRNYAGGGIESESDIGFRSTFF